MNELDSELMTGLLEKRGLTKVSDEREADLLLYNTCSVRDLAERKVMGKIGQLSRRKKHDTIIGIAGCMANAKKASLFEKLPKIDFVLGTNNIHDLDNVLDEVITHRTKAIRADKKFEHELDFSIAKRASLVKAHVSIIRGCNKYCTYCIVPYTRGPEVSRNPDHILEECKKLADQGYKEVTLLGQNVNSYGLDKPGLQCHFHDLLNLLDKSSGIERFRFLTSHPVDITRELMLAIRDLKSVCEFVHFPLQAGSDRILKKMHRIYTIEEYLEKVKMLKELVPGVALGTDIIVGFPTETEDDFLATYNLMKEIEYSVAFIFAYSPRKNTPATRWKNDICEEEKQRRLQMLLNLQNEINSKQSKALLGKTVEVLVERKNQKDQGYLKGRTRSWKKVIFPGDKNLIGTLQNVQITSFANQTLVGKTI